MYCIHTSHRRNDGRPMTECDKNALLRSLWFLCDIALHRPMTERNGPNWTEWVSECLVSLMLSLLLCAVLVDSCVSSSTDVLYCDNDRFFIALWAFNFASSPVSFVPSVLVFFSLFLFRHLFTRNIPLLRHQQQFFQQSGKQNMSEAPNFCGAMNKSLYWFFFAVAIDPLFLRVLKLHAQCHCHAHVAMNFSIRAFLLLFSQFNSKNSIQKQFDFSHFPIFSLPYSLVFAEKIRVGKDYQTVCPDFIPPPERKLDTLNDRALLVWSPTKDIPDMELEKYISVAKEKFGYNGEQALGMLFWHKHDLERAILDLANFTPFPDEWTEEDKVLFEQAFQFHGKSFHRIRQMVCAHTMPPKLS